MMFRILFNAFIFTMLSLPMLVSISSADEFGLDNQGPFGATIDPDTFPDLGGGRIYVCVQLNQEPSAEVYLNKVGSSVGKSSDEKLRAEAKKLAISQLKNVKLQQDEFLSSLRLQKSKADFAVIYSLQRLFNGIIIRTNKRSLIEIAALPHVKALWPVYLKKPLNINSVPLLGAPDVWSGLGIDLSGRNVKVGVIDTGIDYVHSDFGGSGLASDYAANDPVTLGDIDFPTSRVVGGFDFAGELYDPEDSRYEIPQPDPDPMDYGSHGTHVAGTIGGGGVNTDGTPFYGPYNQSLDMSTFRIGPGVAPQCDLYALKVFGTGSSALAGQAIEWAIDPNGDSDFSDRLDVVNLSLGGNYGNGADFESQLYANAAALGLIIVAAAGNSGDLNFISGNPAGHPDVISVAASWHDGTAFLAIAVNSPESIEGSYQAETAGFGPSLSAEGINGELVAGRPALACSELTNASDLAGKIALIDRGECYFVDKVKRAQEAGAIAAIVINNVEGWAFQMGGNATNVVIPSVMISRADGAKIKNALNVEVNVTLSSGIKIYRPELADSIGSFSSRGPSHTGEVLRLKPDITAPGVNVVSALTQSGYGSFSASGTSMACPHMAGVMTLMRDLHPDWSASELKALVMNTARHDVKVFESEPAIWHGPARVGAGRVDAASASKSDVIAFNSENPSWVSLAGGKIDVSEAMDEAFSIRLRNKNVDDAVFEMSLDIKSDMPGVEFVLPENNIVEVPGLGETDVTLVLRSDPKNMKLAHDPTVAEQVNGEYRQWLSEESGYLVFSPQRSAQGEQLRVPLYTLKRPASRMRSAESVVITSKDIDTATVVLEGQGVDGGNDQPYDVKSIVSAFELKYENANGHPNIHGLPGWYDRTLLKMGMFRHVGICSDYISVNDAGGRLEKSKLYVAINTHGVWGAASEILFYLLIDINGDLEPEFIAFNGIWETDVHVVYYYNISQRQIVGASYLNALSPAMYSVPVFMADSMVFPISVEVLGLSGKNSEISFRIHSYLSGSMLMIDDTDWMKYNIGRQGMVFNRGKAGMPSVFDMQGSEIQVEYDLQAAREYKTLGMMLLHHNNESGNRSEKVRFSGLGCETDSDCPEELPYCDDEKGYCVQCSDADDCNSGEVCIGGFCFPLNATDGDTDEEDLENEENSNIDGDDDAPQDIDGDNDDNGSGGSGVAVRNENIVVVNSSCSEAGSMRHSSLSAIFVGLLVWAILRRRSHSINSERSR